MRLYLENDHLASVAARYREQYRNAQPFPHVVLDGLIPDEALDLVVSEFPPPSSEVWKEFATDHEQKLETQGEGHVGTNTSLLLYQFNSAPFLQFLEQLTGIDNILPDPYFLGGGLHQIMRGGKLGIHADFSGHKKLPLERRINVLIYLNRDWQDEYGGALELWGGDRDRCYERILPTWNRTVVFSITDWAFHGHPEPLTCPPGMTRKSIALYYFTVGRPIEEASAEPHGTLFIQRPGDRVPESTTSARGRMQRWSARIRDAVRGIIPERALERVRATRRRRAAARRADKT